MTVSKATVSTENANLSPGDKVYSSSAIQADSSMNASSDQTERTFPRKIAFFICLILIIYSFRTSHPI